MKARWNLRQSVDYIFIPAAVRKNPVDYIIAVRRHIISSEYDMLYTCTALLLTDLAIPPGRMNL